MNLNGPQSGFQLSERGLLRAADRFRAKHGRGLALLMRARLRFALAGIAVIAAAAAIAFWTHSRLESVVRSQLHKVLIVTRDAATEGALLWVDAARRAASSASSDPRLASLLAECLQHQNCIAGEIEDALDPYIRATGFSRVRIANARGEVALSAPQRGASAALPEEFMVRAAKMQPGDVQIVPSRIVGARGPMLLISAVRSQNSVHLGAMVFEMPMHALDRVLRAARAGQSGETYAFDARGRMLSESRFTDQLHQIGLLPRAQTSAAGGLDLRDPGGDVTRGFRAPAPRDQQPLTKMAAAAIAGRDGVDVDGYRDYRGVPVVGAWRWIAPLSMGVVTELDTEEGMKTLRALRRLFAWMLGALGCALAGLIGALGLAGRMHTRAFHAQQLAERCGQYRIVRKIGEGGMGRVYLADHQLLCRPAAIKLLRPDRTTVEAIAAFEDEVQRTSTLTHPNTIAVYDYGRTDDGSLYYVMEYLEGLDLQQLVDRFGPLPCARVLHMLRQLCGSLAEAHEAGLVHRDIKPGNLLICTRGGMADTLKVLDFGVARVQGGERIRGVGASERVLVGTPEYMAPEVFESATRASAETDLYAVGAVGYFMLTGAPPFEAESTHALCLAHLTEVPEPPSRRVGHVIDEILERALMACLAKRREARPQSAEALSSMLGRSELAASWTPAHARAWWSERAEQLDAARASERVSNSTAPPRIAPTRTGLVSE